MNAAFEIEITENDIDEFIIEILQDNNVIYSAKSGEKNLPKTYEIGKHIFKWNGFDSNDIYDSTIFTTRKLKARIKGRKNGKEKTAESGELSFDYKEVDWVDTKIDKNAKRIDITLRINLKEKKIDSNLNKTFNDLLQLAKEGLIEYWGRNSTRPLNGKSINISGVSYEVYITPINTKKKSMPKLKVFAFKHKDGRSRNW